MNRNVCKTCGQKLQSRRLTERENEVLRGIARGLSSGKIAEEIGLSRRTVEVYRANILAKLGAVNSAHALMLANAAGIKL